MNLFLKTTLFVALILTAAGCATTRNTPSQSPGSFGFPTSDTVNYQPQEEQSKSFLSRLFSRD